MTDAPRPGVLAPLERFHRQVPKYREGATKMEQAEYGTWVKVADVTNLLAALPGLGGPQEPTWRCFHCDEVFTDKGAAQEHFGTDFDDPPLCIIKGSDGGLGARIRELEQELSEVLDQRNKYEQRLGLSGPAPQEPAGTPEGTEP